MPSPSPPLPALAFAVAALLGMGPAAARALAQAPAPACGADEARLPPGLTGLPGVRRAVAHLGDGAPGSHPGVVTPRTAGGGCVATGWLLPVEVVAAGNSAWAADRNNGPLWAGRGASAGIAAGIGGSWRALTFALRPELQYSENRAFPLARPFHSTLSLYAYSGTGPIDWPQRFGGAALSRVHPGESFVEARYAGVQLGLSTETLWAGPAARYPLLFSNTAPGHPRVTAGTDRPVDVGIGTLGVTLMAGRLDESDFYDADPANDHRALATVALTFEPAPLPGVTLGATMVRHQTVDDLPTVGSFLSVFRGPFAFLRGADDDDNGLSSVFVDWVEPGSRFRAYLEWGREDFFFDFNELVGEPDHARAYTAGASKAFRWGSRDVVLTAETTQLRSSRAEWYTNSDVRQGHTHRGELLGAYVGPASDAQFLSLSALGGDGASMVGGYLERVRRDEREYERLVESDYGFRGHDVELRGGVTLARGVGPVVLDGWGGVAFRRNRLFIGLDGVNRNLVWDHNLEGEVRAAWTPPL